jgi:hypothetical protein
VCMGVCKESVRESIVLVKRLVLRPCLEDDLFSVHTLLCQPSATST